MKTRPRELIFGRAFVNSMKQPKSTATRVVHDLAIKAAALLRFAFVPVLLISVPVHGASVAANRIETSSAVLSLKAGSGDLIGLEWKHPKLAVIAEARLGENFRILLPKPDYEANYFNSRDQAVRKIDQSPDRIILKYGPLKNKHEEVQVYVTYEIRDTGSQLEFSIEVDNRTERPLAEVLYGIIGGQQGIGERLSTESLVPGGIYDNLAPKLFSQFQPSGEDIGFPLEAAGFTYPGAMVMGWMDVYNPKAGLGYYYANQDPETRVTLLYTEMHPYTKSLSAHDNWPSSKTLPVSEPLGMTMGWVNFPYAKKGIFRAGPVALQAHQGDWRTAARLYRAWFDRHFQISRTPTWLQKEMAWQSVVMAKPEDEILYRFADLPRLAADAKKYGVTTLYLYGWHAGGVDRGYPNYVPDPRLGTHDEFKKALAEMHEMGVRTILLAKLQLADTSTEAFQERLSRYVVEGRWAPDWQVWGHGNGTIGARNYTLHRNFTVLSPSHADFREELIGHYLERIRDGADGFHLESAAMLADHLDFNPNVPATPDRSLPQGTLTTLAEFLKRARTINPNVALSTLKPFDRAIPYFEVNYNVMPRQNRDASSTAQRYTFPELTYTIQIDRPEDFDRTNNGLRYGLAWVIGVRHQTASMDESLTRPLSRYVSELIRIRQQHHQLIFHGRFNDTSGATVSGDKENIRYSVFQSMNPKSEARACVVVNFGDRQESATVSIQGKDGQKATISAPFEADRVATLPVKLTLPPHRAAVVITNQ